jgi:hypothetical protein
MRTPRAALALAVTVSFFAQTTGAADLAAIAARPMLAAQLPPRALPAAPPARTVSGYSRRSAPKAPAQPSAFQLWMRSFLADAGSVASWLVAPEEKTEHRVEWDMPRPAAAPPAPVVEAPEPAVQDRILVTHDPMIVGAAQLLAQALTVPAALPTIPRTECEWVQARGFRFRFVFLDAFGQTIGRSDGFEIHRGDGVTEFLSGQVPPLLRRRSPVFFHGMTVDFLVEVEAQEDLKGLSLSFRQEELDGEVLTPFAPLGVLDLKAGQRAQVSGRTPLLGRQSLGPIGFEKSHLVARVEGEARPRADIPDAALIDPPGN